jgi:hypothetical protein
MLAGDNAMTKSPQRVMNLLLLIAIAATATYWVLQFSAPRDTQDKILAVPTADRSPRTQTMNVAPIAGMFGSSTVSMAASNITVVGVIAQGGKSEGVALLSVDSQPAMAFKAGEPINADYSLQRVNPDGVIVEQGNTTREILLPARQPPAGIEPVR